MTVRLFHNSKFRSYSRKCKAFFLKKSKKISGGYFLLHRRKHPHRKQLLPFRKGIVELPEPRHGTQAAPAYEQRVAGPLELIDGI